MNGQTDFTVKAEPDDFKNTGWPYQPYERRVPFILEPSCHEYAGFWYEPLALDRI
jgi:hypothetical protein